MLNLKKSNYKKPTPIQMQAIPVLMDRRNVIALAPTGSGKTLAYALPIIHRLGENKPGGIRALIYAPTVELGQQIYREVKFLVQDMKNGLKIKFVKEFNT